MRYLQHLWLLGLIGSLIGCTAAPEADTDTASDTSSSDAEGSGTLTLQANGEDFVRQGFTTKDGWQLSFDHVYVNLANATAYQTDPPYQSDEDQELSATTEVPFFESQTVDLAAGDEAAEPIAIATQDAPAGRYNAISWEMPIADDGPAEGSVIVLMGTALKASQTLPFTLKLASPAAYTCGDYVGDERKGILESEGEAMVEATFHFDHIFGDGEAPPDDSINTKALGFEPLATLAQDDEVMLDQDTLEAELSEADYKTLSTALAGLAHVGEGHCQERPLASTETTENE